MLNYLYITKAAALAAGLKFEGTLFGVPAWFDDDGEDVCMATPKIPVLHAWCMLAEFMCELYTHFVPEDETVISPIYIKGPIK